MVKRLGTAGTWRSLVILFTLIGALGSAPGRAGWTEVTVAGELNDVQIWGPGTFTVSTDAGAFQFVDGAQEGGVLDPNADVVGAFWEQSGCVTTVVGPTGAVRSSCGPTLSLTPGVVRMRHVEQGGAGYLIFNNAGAQIGVTHFPQGVSPGTAGGASTVDDLFVPLWPMDVVRPANQSFSVGAFQVQFGGTANTALLMARGGTSLTFTPHVLSGAQLPTAPIRELELLVHSGGVEEVGHVYLAAPDALYRVDTSPLGAGWQPHVRLEEAPTGHTIEGLGLSEDRMATTQGHGMMLLWNGSRALLRRAVPEFRGTPPGSVWVADASSRPAAPAGMTPRLISCEGAHTCVVGHSGGGQSHLAIYRNEAGPAPALTTPSTTIGEGIPAEFTVQGLSDPDGDPLGLRWRIRHNGQTVPEQLSADRSRATVDTSGFGICGDPEPLTAQLEVSDGLSAHEVALERTVSVTRTRRPVIDPQGGRLEEGTSLELEVLPGDFAVCLPSEYAWDVSGPGSLETAGTRATLTPTGPACTPTGASVSVVASALGSGGWAPSAPAIFTMPPWGRSRAPFGAGPIEQHAGSTRTYVAEPHLCSDSQGFPGQVTRWTLVGSLPEGVALTDASGREVTLSGGGAVESGSLQIATDTCAQGAVTFDVLSEVRGVADSAAAAQLRVDVVRYSPPITEADLTLELQRFEGGVLTGRLDTDVSCAEREGWRARLVVLREGVPVMDAVQVSPEGGFELNVPALCAGGQFTLQATLMDPQGASGVTRDAAFAAEPAPANVGSLVDSEVTAACGEGARGALTLVPPAGSCLGATWTWTQVAGPTLTEPVLLGRSVRVQTAGASELADLIGSTLRFEVVAEAEGIGSDTRMVELTIGSEILVDVEARAETALVRNDSPFGAQLTVRNVTHCPLTGLEVQGLLRGASPLGAEVSASDGPHPADWTAPRLTIRGVALEGEAETSLELLLKPSLLGPEHIQLAGEVHLNGVRISPRVEAPGDPDAPTGCGCNGTGAQGWALPGLLAGAFFVLRGRR
ncbi:MAG TPA: hypothetical protein VK013_11305 [Myxococcaceae bacterium]|nr:hypothetical protein [Myxococcaceae bacterium]